MYTTDEHSLQSGESFCAPQSVQLALICYILRHCGIENVAKKLMDKLGNKCIVFFFCLHICNIKLHIFMSLFTVNPKEFISYCSVHSYEQVSSITLPLF